MTEVWAGLNAPCSFTRLALVAIIVWAFFVGYLTKRGR